MSEITPVKPIYFRLFIGAPFISGSRGSAFISLKQKNSPQNSGLDPDSHGNLLGTTPGNGWEPPEVIHPNLHFWVPAMLIFSMV